MTDSSPSLNENLERFKNFFATPLTETWTLTKSPRRFETHYGEAQEGRDEIAQVFLRTGFVVWLAYLRTKQRCEGGKHYTGQKADLDTLSAFQKLSRQEQAVVATALSHTAVHPSVQAAKEEMQTMLEPQTSQGKRPRTCDSKFSCFT
jgi:hypothetical protein